MSVTVLLVHIIMNVTVILHLQQTTASQCYTYPFGTQKQLPDIRSQCEDFKCCTISLTLYTWSQSLTRQVNVRKRHTFSCAALSTWYIISAQPSVRYLHGSSSFSSTASAT